RRHGLGVGRGEVAVVAVHVHAADDGGAGRLVAVVVGQVDVPGALDLLRGGGEGVGERERLLAGRVAGVRLDDVQLLEAAGRARTVPRVVGEGRDRYVPVGQRLPGGRHLPTLLVGVAGQHLEIPGGDDE